MRRLRRIIFNGLTVLSLLLCLGTCIVDVRSYWVKDLLIWSDGYDNFGLSFWAWSACTSRGGLTLTTFFRMQGVELFGGMAWGLPPGRHIAWYPTSATDSQNDYPFGAHGRRFGLDTRSDGKIGSEYTVLRLKQLAIPLPMVASMFAVLPAVRLGRALRRGRNFKAGLCRSCGYDLRATPNRCPECGTPARASSSAIATDTAAGA